MPVSVYRVIETKLEKSSDGHSQAYRLRCVQTVSDWLPVFAGNIGAVDIGGDGMRFFG